MGQDRASLWRSRLGFLPAWQRDTSQSALSPPGRRPNHLSAGRANKINGRSITMFERFGEFDSAEEINDKAAELKASGDAEALSDLARENGLDEEDARDYLDGVTGEFTTPALAAIGKIEAETEKIELFGVFTDWKGEILSMCQGEDFAVAVRRKGKSIAECFACVMKEEMEHRKTVDKKITALIKGWPNGAAISTLTRKDQADIIRRYYLS